LLDYAARAERYVLDDGAAYRMLADEVIAGEEAIPLAFASNGRPFTSESDTLAGIWTMCEMARRRH
jgi:hypothetical protein